MNQQGSLNMVPGGRAGLDHFPPASRKAPERTAAVLPGACLGSTLRGFRHRRRGAAQTNLSEGTVRNHLSSSIGTTGARTRAAAVRLAQGNGRLL